MQNSILKWVEDSVKRDSEKIFCVDEKTSISYKELRCKARAIARKLYDMKIINKIEVSSPVVVYMEKNCETLVSFMGIAYSGNFYSPIDVSMPNDRAKKILDVLKPYVVITTKELVNKIKEIGYDGEVIYYEEIDENVDTRIIDEIVNNIIDTDLLYVLFTSGSTGTPKGVSITHRSVIDYIDCVTEDFKISDSDKFGNQAPFYFDNSILDIYSVLKMTATLYIIPKKLFFQPVKLLTYIKENDINNIFWVPSALIVVSKLDALGTVDLSKQLKRVMFCGEVMPNKQLNVWRKYLPNTTFVNLYGPTEITDACTYYSVNREFDDDEPLPIGKPMRNTEILVLNYENKLVKGDEVGELCVRGTSLSMGYYNNPEKTAECFIQNPLNPYLREIIYRTGDIVKYNEYGELIYMARKDFQIKHLGHRIELGEIETATSAIEGISQNCCLYDEENDKIVLFIDANIDAKFVKEKLKIKLPEYMIPNKIIYIGNMPINANGKIDRVKIKNEYIIKK